MARSVKLVDVDKHKDVYVNPEYVTSIESCPKRKDGAALVWVVGHAGYGTYQVMTEGPVSIVNDKIFGEANGR